MHVLLASGRAYNAAGQLVSQLLGNGLVETRYYDLAGRLVTQGVGPVTRAHYYDEAGNLTSFNENNFARTLGYDLLDRVIGSDQSNGPTQTFAYDANGNRTSVSTDGTPITYTYTPGSNRLAQVGMTAWTYDGAGNTVTDGARTYDHSPTGDLTQVRSGAVTLGTYANDVDHRRVLRTAESEAFYFYDKDGLRIATYTSFPGTTYGNGYILYAILAETDTLYADGEPIAQIQPNPNNGTETLVYLHPDHLGAPRSATSTSGTVVWRWRGSAFGEGGIDDDPDADGTHITIDLRHPGQWFDAETGLFDNWHRSYEPGTGRYVESDPIGIAGGINTYGYALQNPITNTDPLGLFTPYNHNHITVDAIAQAGGSSCSNLQHLVALVDTLPESQAPANSFWHAMRDGTNPKETDATAKAKYDQYVDQQWKTCTCEGLARTLHAIQDSFPVGHAGFQPWSGGLPSVSHVYHDGYPSPHVRSSAVSASANAIRHYEKSCKMGCPK